MLKIVRLGSGVQFTLNDGKIQFLSNGIGYFSGNPGTPVDLSDYNNRLVESVSINDEHIEDQESHVAGDNCWIRLTTI